MASTLILTVFFGLTTGAEAPAAQVPLQADFWVAPDGSDSNPGGLHQPFATLGRAQKAVRERIAQGLKADVRVVIRAGVYELGEPLAFGPEDSGTAPHAVIYAACPGEKVVVSGGSKITGWKRGPGDVWTAEVPGAREGKWHFRALFVGGRRAVRARTPNRDDKAPERQLKAVDLSKDLKRFTVTLAPGLVKNWASPADVEMVIAGNWEINRKRVEAVDEKSALVVLAPPHISGPDYIVPSPGRWCHFENAREMLDQPGEWHLDRKAGVVCYWPLPGEDLGRIEVVAPRLVQLVKVAGTADRPVRNLHFDGISFEHTQWPLPPGGYMGIQACHYSTAAAGGQQSGRVPAALDFRFAEQCSVEDGTIARLGGCGLEFGDGTVGNLVQGNEVVDVAGNGVNVGGGVPRANRVCNNHVHACGREFYGAVGIWVGIARETVVAHNLVHDLPYTGISVGWEWSDRPTPCEKNLIEFNHIYDVMNRLCDGGGIYTLGLQPGTVIRGNHIHDVHRSAYAQGAPNNGMFIDQGSKGYLFQENVIYSTAAELVRFNQCEQAWHTWRDNHFGEPAAVKQSGKEIIAQAGPQPPYRERFQPR